MSDIDEEDEVDEEEDGEEEEGDEEEVNEDDKLAKAESVRKDVTTLFELVAYVDRWENMCAFFSDKTFYMTLCFSVLVKESQRLYSIKCESPI